MAVGLALSYVIYGLIGAWMGRLPQTSGNLPMACIWKEFGGTSEGCHYKFFPLPKHLQNGLYIYLGLSHK